MNKIEKILAIAAVLMFLGVLLLVRELKIVSNDSQASGPRRGSIFHSREDRDIQTYVPLPVTSVPQGSMPPHIPGSTSPSDQFPPNTTPPKGSNGTIKPVPTYNGGGGYFGASWLCQYFGVGCDYSLPLPSKYN
jgi:hypothetical protein